MKDKKIKKAWLYALIIELSLVLVVFMCSQFLGVTWVYIGMTLHFPSSLMAYYLTAFLDYHTSLGENHYLTLFFIYAITIVFQVLIFKAFIEGMKKTKDSKNER